MAKASGASSRGVWRNIHLWIGLGLFVVLAPLGLTGSLLVWDDGLDKLAHPARYAVTASGGAHETPAPGVYLAAAARAFGARAVPAQLRMPKQPGLPATVTGYAAGKPPPGQRPPSLTAWIDPATGRVLDVGDPRREIVGLIHRIHGNMMLPRNGRMVVGWLGVAMLASSLTGLCLWWPRNNAILRGLRWTRSRSGFSNLHHMIGFWICVPLAALSLSGAYIAFPQAMRAFTGPPQPKTSPAPAGGDGAGFAQPLPAPAMTLDQAVTAARLADNGLIGAQVLSVSLPTATDKPAWRIQFKPAKGDVQIVKVPDGGGEASVQPGQGQGGEGGADPIARFMRRLHDGSGFGPVWRVIVAVAGFAPTVLGLSGAVIWLTRRKAATLD